LGNNLTKFYLNLFRFDIFIVRCLGVTSFLNTVDIYHVMISVTLDIIHVEIINTEH